MPFRLVLVCVISHIRLFFFLFFFFNDTATTEIYTLSLHDALPISAQPPLSISSMVKANDHSRLWLSWKSSTSDVGISRLAISIDCAHPVSEPLPPFETGVAYSVAVAGSFAILLQLSFALSASSIRRSTTMPVGAPPCTCHSNLAAF